MVGTRFITLAALAVIGFVVPTDAQNMSFGADNFYRSNIVAVQPVTFKNVYGMTVAANLFTLKNLTNATGSPAIVVGPPHGAVKEQSANLYATKLAEQGFVTMAIDTQYWGGSAATPHNAVGPDMYSETFSAAVDYLGLQRFVDRERIGGLGICGSGSFVVSAAKIDSRIKAVATSSMYDMGAAVRDGIRNGLSLEQRKAIIDDFSRQRWVEAAGGELRYADGIPSERPVDNEILAEFWDFYRTSRGEFTAPGSNRTLNQFKHGVSNLKLMNFYPFDNLDAIAPRPLLFVSGDQAHSREFSEDAFAAALEPKELHWVRGAGHVDLYDRVELIPFDKFTEFFRTHLAANATATRQLRQ